MRVWSLTKDFRVKVLKHYSTLFIVTSHHFYLETETTARHYLNSQKMHKVPDLTVTFQFAGTSFSRSQLQLVTPLLEALPGLLSPALPNILSLTSGLFILFV
jgi:hypothetical protein